MCLKFELSLRKKTSYVVEQALLEPIITLREMAICPTKLLAFLVEHVEHFYKRLLMLLRMPPHLTLGLHPPPSVN
jgi:hypothetical protein